MLLRDYQQEISDRAARLLATKHICYLAMECRTGKTLTALESARKFGARNVLFVTKLKAIPSVQSDHKLLGEPFALTVVNYESAHKSKGRYDLVILDEAHSIGAFPRPSLRAKTLKEMCKGLPIIYLSGTPSPESYAQLYHQFWVSSYSPFAQFTNFYKWAKVYVDVRMRMINGRPINDYSNAKTDKVKAAIEQLFIDYSQEEAGFEANIEETMLHVPMNPNVSHMLTHLKRHKIVEHNGVTVVADTPAKLLTKMHQLSSGTIIDDCGEHHIVDYSKAEFLRARFRGQRLAVFYVYQSELEMLKEIFPDWTSVPEEFQKQEGNSKVFLGQVRSAREGVRLDTADALVFYNLEYSYLSYEQGRNRLSSKERTAPARVYFLCSDCGIEKDIMKAVHSKEDFTLSYYASKCRGLQA